MGRDAMFSQSSSSARTVAILTLGCKLNQADSQALARELLAHGCQVIDRPAPADALIINACSVTHVADRKSRHLVRLARRLAPEATVVLTGCYEQNGSGHDLAQRLGADWLVANADKPGIAQRLLRHWQEQGGLGPGRKAIEPSDGLRTRAFVKVQEGCNEVCAFCIVPRTRGRERSVPIGEVVAEVLARQAAGVKEVVLTGTQVGNYGRDLGLCQGPRELLVALLTETTIPRLRLSSLQAQDISESLLRLWQNRRLCPHFHLPLQSGSDHILAAMRRRYTVDQFRQAVALIRRWLPDVAVTTDVIVGFPGEGDDDFQRTHDLCQELAFAAIHVFPYSRRPGTLAALAKEQVPDAVKRQRLERMLELARTSADAFRARFRGRTLDVLWEEARALLDGQPPLWRGLTDNYLRVYTSARDGSASGRCPGFDLTNRLLPARLGQPLGDGLWGELEPADDASPVRVD
ncbi:MAG: tRNA (N(6)-L-threonylcarbamoyladenosine(37)-C(2))-methylthiotransferase MtaB [Dehalococcoidia bacterium]|nr:tRNA (N(6)-L-threonylcarbamoyladenosine(37)-C(2))-methylthiotransferase MtaB [Dehalococcoidia bacterium]